MREEREAKERGERGEREGRERGACLLALLLGLFVRVFGDGADQARTDRHIS